MNVLKHLSLVYRNCVKIYNNLKKKMSQLALLYSNIKNIWVRIHMYIKYILKYTYTKYTYTKMHDYIETYINF